MKNKNNIKMYKNNRLQSYQRRNEPGSGSRQSDERE